MRVAECLVVSNTGVARGYKRLVLGGCSLGRVDPGQFVMVKVDGREVLLRRPFTVYDYDEERGVLEILYKVTGRGTRAMAELRESDVVSVLGPLGRGFPLDCPGKALLLARGVGLASLTYLGKKLREAGCSVVTVGSFRGRGEDLATGNKLVEGFSSRVYVLYDEEGTSSLENVRRVLFEENPSAVYTCGSKRLIRLLKQTPFKAYASVEERMGCGLGACLSCVVRTVHGYKLACRDGPVFDVRELEV
ncbi:FAD-binding oxidoreductase [Thermogladius sp. KZ2Tp1]|uniref:iron-sulfur cluster-binding protein n=1 Tax=Thermogladius sp. KZ2Tp1 TaxID=3136289 RepID=UPI003DA81380